MIGFGRDKSESIPLWLLSRLFFAFKHLLPPKLIRNNDVTAQYLWTQPLGLVISFISDVPVSLPQKVVGYFCLRDWLPHFLTIKCTQTCFNCHSSFPFREIPIGYLDFHYLKNEERKQHNLGENQLFPGPLSIHEIPLSWWGLGLRRKSPCYSVSSSQSSFSYCCSILH